jgi:periplasmic copper chaperone A
MLRLVLVFLAASILAAAAHAQQFSAGSLVIGNPWSRPTAEGMPTGVAYLVITNRGHKPDTLIAARSPAAARVEFHRTTFEDGMAKMRAERSVTVAPGSTVRAEPGGLHLMLIDLKAPLIAGTEVPLVLSFEGAGDVTVTLKVTAP